MGLKFVECDTCRVKSGTPILCSGCVHNRTVIENYQQFLGAMKDALEHVDHPTTEQVINFIEEQLHE